MESSIQDILYPDNQRIVDRIKEEISSAFGSDTWDEVICDGCPDGNMDDHSLCATTQKMLERIDEFKDRQRVQEAFANVKHALKHSDFAWAREKFLQYNDIDLFAEAVLQDSINTLCRCNETGESFYGQPITKQALEYIKGIDDLFYGKRKGNTITATAIPFMTEEYLQAKDTRTKRYYACHCQFARKSILSEKTVSKTLCYCSMGHTKLFWEAALNVSLFGKVESSALGGDLLCRFSICLPDSIMEKYVHSKE